jgi:uncharacterized oxidoreductase
VTQEEAGIVANSLVQSNLCGHDSHGVVRVAGYVKQLRKGELVSGADLTVLAETESLLVTDANFGFGMVQAEHLIGRLVPKAKQQGIACGTTRRCGHLGRMGEWAERIARQGLAGLVTVNDNGVLQCVAPPGGTQPRISTNPISIGVPTGEEPLILDISTSVVANGKVLVVHKAGKQCPPGWLLDSEGNPTTDPSVRFRDPRGTLLPMGGEQQGYKGFGLGLLLDVLVGGLSGGNCPPAPEGASLTNNALFVLWDPDRFCGSEHFVGEADRLVQYVRDVRRKPGVEKIRLPGDHSLETARQRRNEGIPLDGGTWQSLVNLGEEFGVQIPAV